MFGTLVSAPSGQSGGLEFVQNPDHSDAINRNLRTKIHVSCAFCRSRKARCSGGKAPCQRCASMGVKCVFPPTHGRGGSGSGSGSGSSSGRRERSHRQVFRTDSNRSTPPSRSPADSPAPHNMWSPASDDEAGDKATALTDLSNLTFDYDDPLLMPWTSALESPVAVNVPPQQQPRFGFERASSLSLSSSEGVGLDLSPPSLEFSHKSTSPSKLSLLGMDGLDWEADLLRSPPEIREKSTATTPHSSSSSSSGSSGCCLLAAIAFLERLSARREGGAERVDALLAELRSAIETLSGFAGCERCATSRELSLLLTMLVRQIHGLCRRSTAAYQSLVLTYEASTDTPDRDALVSISVATYRASPREKLHMLRSLLTLQIAEFQTLVHTIEAR